MARQSGKSFHGAHLLLQTWMPDYHCGLSFCKQHQPLLLFGCRDRWAKSNDGWVREGRTGTESETKKNEERQTRNWMNTQTWDTEEEEESKERYKYLAFFYSHRLNTTSNISFLPVQVGRCCGMSVNKWIPAPGTSQQHANHALQISGTSSSSFPISTLSLRKKTWQAISSVSCKKVVVSAVKQKEQTTASWHELCRSSEDEKPNTVWLQALPPRPTAVFAETTYSYFASAVQEKRKSLNVLYCIRNYTCENTQIVGISCCHYFI